MILKLSKRKTKQKVSKAGNIKITWPSSCVKKRRCTNDSRELFDSTFRARKGVYIPANPARKNRIFQIRRMNVPVFWQLRLLLDCYKMMNIEWTIPSEVRFLHNKKDNQCRLSELLLTATSPTRVPHALASSIHLSLKTEVLLSNSDTCRYTRANP